MHRGPAEESYPFFSLLEWWRGYGFSEQLGSLCGCVVGAVERYIAVEPHVQALFVLGGQMDVRGVGGVADDFSQGADICADSARPGDYWGNCRPAPFIPSDEWL